MSVSVSEVFEASTDRVQEILSADNSAAKTLQLIETYLTDNRNVAGFRCPKEVLDARADALAKADPKDRGRFEGTFG
jgi:hypothetical protein